MTAEQEAIELGTFAAWCDVRAAHRQNPEIRKMWEEAAAHARELQNMVLEEFNEQTQPIRRR